MFISLDKFTKYSIYTLLLFFMVITIGINSPLSTMQNPYTTSVKASPRDNLQDQTAKLITLTNQYGQAHGKEQEELYIQLAVATLERKLTLQSILRDNPQQAMDTLLDATIQQKIPPTLIDNIEKSTVVEGIVLIPSQTPETNRPSKIYLRTSSRDMNLIFIANPPQLINGSTIRVTGFILDTDIIIKNGLESVQKLK